MVEYNLERLGWANFEQLVVCLLHRIIGPGISSFSGSADQGRDAIFSGKAPFPNNDDCWTGKWVFQVKFRDNALSNSQSIRQELTRTMKSEVARLRRKRKIKPANYVLITNCPLTAANKDELSEAIKSVGAIKNVAIIARADIEQHLNNHSAIAVAFPSLLGIRQLSRLISPDILQRSVDYLESIRGELSTFVVTRPFLDAYAILNRHNFCILTGPPKMGKTCTADALAAAHASLGYEIVSVRSQADFYRTPRLDDRQFFVCDDVFGDISLKSDLRDEWTRGISRLLQSLSMKRRMLWTSRSYILNEALDSSRMAEDAPALPLTNTVTVAVDRLKLSERAQILYNHAKLACLPEHVKRFLRKQCYEISSNPYYSPESIRQLCCGRLVEFAPNDAISDECLLESAMAFLAAPGDAWKKAFRAAWQAERLLCTEVMAAGGEIAYSALRDRYLSEVGQINDQMESFESSFKAADGTFLKIRKSWDGENIVTFYHPSMRDLMNELAIEDPRIRAVYLRKLPLKEVRSLLTSASQATESDSHRLRITDKSELQLILTRLRDELVPRASLQDVTSLLLQLQDVIISAQNTKSESPMAQSALDAVCETVCSATYFRNNESKDTSAWAAMLRTLSKLLLHSTNDICPTYLGELIRRCDNSTHEVEFWELVDEAAKIAPIAVLRAISLDQREDCRSCLEEEVSSAIAETRRSDFNLDHEKRSSWCSRYRSLPEQCGEYLKLFPDDDAFDDLADLEHLLVTHDSSDGDPPDDYSAEEPKVPYAESPAGIRELFMDL